jgi:NAD(P)H-hydrate epimerase
MTHWVTPQEMADMDRAAIGSGTPGAVLMERAGAAVSDCAEKMLGGERMPVIVLAGPGNNGGDGYVAARNLLRRGFPVVVHRAFSESREPSLDCAINRRAFLALGGAECSIPPFRPGLVIDALLGTGFSGRLGGEVLKAVETFLPGRCPVLAVDSPTGVNGITGEADPCAVKADVTVTFAAPKLGHLIPPGCGYTGALFLADIGIPVVENSLREVMDMPGARALLPDRPVDAHKGTFGKVLILAGSERMPGASLLAALGALRSGAGLVELCVPLPAAPLVGGRIPEALCSYFLPGDITSLPDAAEYDAAVVGPGMGNDQGVEKVVRHVVDKWKLPLVLDADGLNVLGRGAAELLSGRGDMVLTPHPGELSRLTGCSKELGKRFDAAAKLSAASNSVVLLKGRPSQVFLPDGGRILNPTGNHGMASGGSGDVLAGMVAGFAAQGVPLSDAAPLGAYLHGLSGDIAASVFSPRSLLPTDLADGLGRAFAMVERGLDDALIRLEGGWNGRLWNIPG